MKTKRSVSISPTGEVFNLPTPADYKKEFAKLKKLVAAQRAQGREIVVVVGLGFVGAVMAAVVADSTDENGTPGQVRHRHAAAQHPQLLEDPAAQPRRFTGQSRGPGSRSPDLPVRQGEEDAHGHLHRGGLKLADWWWWTCSAIT